MFLGFMRNSLSVRWLPRQSWTKQAPTISGGSLASSRWRRAGRWQRGFSAARSGSSGAALNRELCALRDTVRSALCLATMAPRFAKHEDRARLAAWVEASRPRNRCGTRWPECRFTPAGTWKESPAYGFGKGRREGYALLAARGRAAIHSETVRRIYTRQNSFRDPQFAEGRTAPGDSAVAPSRFLRRGSPRAPVRTLATVDGPARASIP